MFKKSAICERIQKFETLTPEFICSELAIAKKKWLCFSIHWPPTPENWVPFFEELTDCFSKGNESYESFIVLGDSNIDVKVAGRELGKLEKFCDLFNLTNLIRSEAKFTRDHKSTIDLILILISQKVFKTLVSQKQD